MLHSLKERNVQNGKELSAQPCTTGSKEPACLPCTAGNTVKDQPFYPTLLEIKDHPFLPQTAGNKEPAF